MEWSIATWLIYDFIDMSLGRREQKVRVQVQELVRRGCMDLYCMDRSPQKKDDTQQKHYPQHRLKKEIGKLDPNQATEGSRLPEEDMTAGAPYIHNKSQG